MNGSSASALDSVMSLLSNGSRSLLKLQEAARAIFDREPNRIIACFSVGCVLSDGVISSRFSHVAVVNAIWILFDMFRSEGPAQSPFLYTFLHVLKHRKSPPGLHFFIRHVISYPSEKFAANQCADKILLLDDSHTRPPLSPNVDVAELERKCCAQGAPQRRLSSGTTAWIRSVDAAPPVPPPETAASSPMTLCVGFEAPFPRPSPPMLSVSARELRWLNPFPESSLVFCNDMMSVIAIALLCRAFAHLRARISLF